MIRTVVSLYSKILNVLLGLGTLIVVVLLTAIFSQVMPGFFAFVLAVPIGFLLTAAFLGAGFLILDMRNTLLEIATTLKQTSQQTPQQKSPATRSAAPRPPQSSNNPAPRRPQPSNNPTNNPSNQSQP